MKRRLIQFFAIFTMGAWALFHTGCESLMLGSPKPPENIKGLRISSRQLRVRVRVMAKPLAGIVVEAADAIIAQSEDPEVRRAALKWKISAVSSIREALFLPEPIAALLDIWALNYQMIDFFETGHGATLFKDQTPIALAAARKINDYLEELTDGIVADLSDTESRNRTETLLRDWAAENPINLSIGSRESINNQVTEIAAALGVSLGEAVDTMVTTMDDLNRKLEVYSDQIPAQMRWQAEVFAGDALDELKLRESVETIPLLMETAIAALETARSAPAVIASEREVLLEALRAETTLALEALQQERKEVMEQISLEREIVLADIAANRIALTEDLRSERKAIEEMVARERDILLDETGAMGERLIDRFFVNMTITLVMVGLYIALLATIILWFLNHRRSVGRTDKA